MAFFTSRGIELAYHDVGHGDPILLIHGFASNINANWRDTGWIKTLSEAGRRVIAIDNRGHGASENLRDPKGYEASNMAEDARALLEHLEIGRADIMGYSMGARISCFLAVNHPDVVRSVIFGGIGAHMLVDAPSRNARNEAIAAGLEAADKSEISDPAALGFRLFAEATKSDLLALAACMRAASPRVTPEQLAALPMPVLIVSGTDDEIARDPERLATLIGHAELRMLDNRDHMKAVGDRRYKQAALAFLNERP